MLKMKRTNAPVSIVNREADSDGGKETLSPICPVCHLVYLMAWALEIIT